MTTIIHLTTVHLRTDIRIFIKEARTIASNSIYNVLLMVADGKGNVDEEQGKVSIHDLGDLGKGRLMRMLRGPWRAFLAISKIKPAVVHFHDPELIPLGLLLKLVGLSVIYDVHEDMPEQILSKEYIPRIIRVQISKLVDLMEKKISTKFDAIICATDIIRDKFRLKHAKHAFTVWNYPLISEMPYDVIPWNKRKKSVCYIGSISEIRGIYTMVKGVDKTSVTLMLGGSFSSQSLLNKVSNMPGWAKTHYLGYLNRREVINILGLCRAGLHLVYPLRRHLEGIPTKMFEYMASGIPVIVTNSPYWEPIVHGYNCGLLVDVMSNGQVAEAIEWIIEHPREAEQMGLNGRRAIKEKYNWESEEKKLLSIYHKLIGV